jgi:hypothetical protein
LTYEKTVATAHYQVARILDETWTPNSKRKLLMEGAPYFNQIADAEHEAYRCSDDSSLTNYDQIVADRDMSILNFAGRFLYPIVMTGRLDRRTEIMISAPDFSEPDLRPPGSWWALTLDFDKVAGRRSARLGW